MRGFRLSSLMGLLAAVFCAAAWCADDPAGMFLEAYQEFKAAEQLEIDGRLDDALAKYRYTASMLEQIKSKAPDYSPVVIDYRLRKTRESIGRVEGLQRSRPASPPSVAGIADPAGIEGDLPVRELDDAPVRRTPTTPRRLPVSPSTQPDSPITSSPPTTYRIPIPRQRAEPAPGQAAPAQQAPSAQPGVVDPAPGVSASTLRMLELEIRSLRAQLQQEQVKSDDLERRLLETTARERSALHEVDRTKVHVVELKSQLAQTRQALEDARVRGEQLARSRQSDAARIGELEAEVAGARADLEVAEDFNADLYAKLERAAEYIEASEEIRAGLENERNELARKMEEDSSAEVVRLEAENKALSDARDELAAKLDTAEEAAAARDELAAKLAESEKKIRDLAALDPERDRMMADLRAEVESANEALASVREELEAGKAEIAALEAQLAAAAADPVAADESAAENALLRGIVIRQLQSQAKRQQARKLVGEELEKLQVRSESLLEQLDALAAAETALEGDERALFAEMLAVAEAEADGGDGPLNFAMVVTKSLGEGESAEDSDLPGELLEDAASASELLGENRLDEARAVYVKLAEQAPESYFAAFKLGEVYHLMESHREAAAQFERALEIRPGCRFALYGLGIAQLRAGDALAAARSLGEAVEADPENYRAHYFLGRALVESGDIAAATREIERSLDLNPEYAPAHLNLAMLYATREPPAKDLARQHYEKATALGASPDASIERLIQ